MSVTFRLPLVPRLRRYVSLYIVLLIVVGLLEGCNSNNLNAGSSTSATTTASSSSVGSPAVLKVGILSTIDSLPIQVADAEGLFQRQGLNVVIVTFASAIAREAAMQAGELDGELNDVISTAILNKGAVQVRIVRTALRTNGSRPIFQILSSPANDIMGPADLKGKSIAISNNTIVDFMTTQLLTRNGLSPTEVSLQHVADISLRMQMLNDNKVDAAILPEPLASLAISKGAWSVVADTGTDIGPTNTLIFKTSVLNANSDSVRRFLLAYDAAVVKVNGNFDSYRRLLVDRKLLSPQLERTFVAMPLPPPEVPTPSEVEQFSDWLVQKGIIDAPLDYQTTVDTAFVVK